jgi:hypothetical protein
MRLTKAAGLCAVTLAVAVTGCGKSDQVASGSSQVSGKASGTGTTHNSTVTKPAQDAASTKTAVTARANAICAAINREREQITLTSKQSYLTLVPSLIATERRAIKELEAVIPPTSVARDWRQILADARTIVNESTTTLNSIRQGNIAAVRMLLTHGKETQEQMATLSTRDGFDECARSV